MISLSKQPSCSRWPFSFQVSRGVGQERCRERRKIRGGGEREETERKGGSREVRVCYRAASGMFPWRMDFFCERERECGVETSRPSYITENYDHGGVSGDAIAISPWYRAEEEAKVYARLIDGNNRDP